MTNVAIVVLLLVIQLAIGMYLVRKPEERPRSKRNYMIGFVALGLAAAGLAGWQTYRTQSLIEKEQSIRRTVREGLGSLISDGSKIQLRCFDRSSPPPVEEAKVWAARAETFLRKHLGDSYVSRFRSSAGLPMTGIAISSPPYQNVWSGMHNRLARLEEFSKENVK